MTSMRSADGRNPPRVAGGREPVMNGSADLAALDGRLPWTVVASDQQDHAISAFDCALQPSVNRLPCAVEVHAVKVEDPVGLDCTGAETSVPVAIERCAGLDLSRRSRPRRSNRSGGLGSDT
jgi:hypothetical protein